MINFIIFSYWFTIYTLLPFGFNLTRKNTGMTSAFIHCTLVTTLSAICLYQYNIDFSRENLFFEIITIKLSLGYFIFDLLLLLLFDRQKIFILHHLCAITVFIKILYLGVGSASCMLLLFLGEIANPARLSKQMIYPYNKFTYNILSFIFSWMFIIIRCFIMTYYSFVLHDTFFSILDSTSQIILYSSCGAGLLGGYYWSYLLIKKNI